MGLRAAGVPTVGDAGGALIRGGDGAVLQPANLCHSLGKVSGKVVSVGLYLPNQPNNFDGCPVGLDDETNNVLRLETLPS